MAAAAIMICLQLYIPRFQHLQSLFIKIINKKQITDKDSRQPVVHFQSRIQFLRMVTEFTFGLLTLVFSSIMRSVWVLGLRIDPLCLLA